MSPRGRSVSAISAVEEQGVATAEIARSIGRTSKSASVVSANIGGVRQAAIETGAAASQVLGATSELSCQAEQLTSAVGGFVTELHAA